MQTSSFRCLLAASTLALAACAAGSSDDAPPTGSVTSSSTSSSSSGGGASTTSSSGGGQGGTGQGGAAQGGMGQGGGGAGQGGGGAGQGGGGAGQGGAGQGGAGGAGSTTSSTTTSSSSSTGGGGAGGCAPYSHTITIDGVNDFSTTDESFASTSTGYTGYIAWDSAYVYFGMKGPDVANTSGTRWLLAYLGTPAAASSGTMVGQPYGGGVLSPMLPFAASWHFRAKSGGDDYSSVMVHTNAWIESGFDLTGDIFRTGDFIEARIPLTDLGNPTTLRLHLSMINEQTGGQYTFAGVPQSSFTDAIDPDYTKYLELELGGCDAPTMYTPL